MAWFSSLWKMGVFQGTWEVHDTNPAELPGASEAASGLDASLGLRGTTFGTCLPELLGIS